MTASIAQMPLMESDGFVPCSLDEANRLLVEWGHYLGPVNRPFGSQSFAFLVAGRPVSVAVSCSAVSATVAHARRRIRAWAAGGAGPPLLVGSLGPLGSCFGGGERSARSGGLTGPRERRSPTARTTGTKVASTAMTGGTQLTTKAGSSGGGAWSRKRYATDAVHGQKTAWLWRYSAASGATAGTRVALSLRPSRDGRGSPDGAITDRGLGGRQELPSLPLLDRAAVGAQELGDFPQPHDVERHHGDTIRLVVCPDKKCRSNPLQNVVDPCRVTA